MQLKMVLVAAAIAFGASAIISQIDLRGARSAAPVIKPQPSVPVSEVSYTSLLAQLDGRIDGLQARADGRPKDWLIRMHLAATLLERATLSNRPADYDRIQAVLDETFAMVPPGTGPVVVAARFNFSIHRLADAEKYLDMVDRHAIPRAADQIVARALRADIAVQRGQYELASKGLTELAAVAPAVANAPLALYHAKTGEPDEARALLEALYASTETSDPQRRAWLKLQLGILAMDRGELQPAMQHLHDAEAELSGWWLVHEYIAEVHDRRDEHAEAIAIYEELVRTHELPQHIDALAGLYKHTGEPAKAEELITRAAARWELQLARYPESAMGHGLQHHLQFGTPERALELARANVALRPGGDAQVALARALLKAEEPAEALLVVERVLATPYRTARLHDVAAQVYTALGDTAAAEQQLTLRLGINPRFTSGDHSH